MIEVLNLVPIAIQFLVVHLFLLGFVWEDVIVLVAGSFLGCEGVEGQRAVSLGHLDILELGVSGIGSFVGGCLDDSLVPVFLGLYRFIVCKGFV